MTTTPPTLPVFTMKDGEPVSLGEISPTYGELLSQLIMETMQTENKLRAEIKDLMKEKTVSEAKDREIAKLTEERNRLFKEKSALSCKQDMFFERIEKRAKAIIESKDASITKLTEERDGLLAKVEKVNLDHYNLAKEKADLVAKFETMDEGRMIKKDVFIVKLCDERDGLLAKVEKANLAYEDLVKERDNLVKRFETLEEGYNQLARENVELCNKLIEMEATMAEAKKIGAEERNAHFKHMGELLKEKKELAEMNARVTEEAQDLWKERDALLARDAEKKKTDIENETLRALVELLVKSTLEKVPEKALIKN